MTATDAAAELLVQTVMELAEQAERIETEAAEAGRLAAELAGEVADEAATAMEDKEEAEDMARASVVDPALEAAADRHHKSVRQQGQLEADAMEHAENGLRWFEGKRCNDFICMTARAAAWSPSYSLFEMNSQLLWPSSSPIPLTVLC